MSGVVHGISRFFNWLASEPKNHWTLRQLIPKLTDGEVEVNPPRPINRVARVIERVATVGGLVSGIYGASHIYGLGMAAGMAYSSVLISTALPLLVMPVLAASAAWVVGGVLTLGINKAADMANGLDNWLGDTKRKRDYELKEQGKIKTEIPKNTLPRL